MEQYVWLDGEILSERDSHVSILTHSLQYGSGIFEGIRAYDTKKGTAIFRIKDHVRRFFMSAKIYNMDLGIGEQELEGAIIEVVKKNKLKSCYIRPFAFYNDSNIGLGTEGKKISTYVAAVPFGAYFGSGKEKGISCKVSSWQRINSSILPPHAKASGNYANSIIAKKEAMSAGADEAIMLSHNGYVAEGTGENIFMVKDKSLITPSEDADILIGITRNTIMQIAKSMRINVVERNIHREELYTANEVFFSGTAAEITPITKIDGNLVASGKPGPITKILSGKYSDATLGKNGKFVQWLTYI